MVRVNADFSSKSKNRNDYQRVFGNLSLPGEPHAINKDSTMASDLHHFLADLSSLPRDAEQAVEQLSRHLPRQPPLDPAILPLLCNWLAALADTIPPDEADRAMQQALEQLRGLMPRPWANQHAAFLTEESVMQLGGLYKKLPANGNARSELLWRLTATGSEPALRAFAELLAADPPWNASSEWLPFVPLFQHPQLSVESLFPRLWEALSRQEYAALILDFANHVTRNGLAAEHPGKSRAEALNRLLTQVARSLEKGVESSRDDASSSGKHMREFRAGIPLAISLCDTAGLLADPVFLPGLHQAADLPHRRIRAEAAAALVRLGDKSGEKMLEELAAEPVVRRRVLQYLEELAIQDVAQQFRSPFALAEGDLAAWLAEPTQFGMAPHELELWDSRRLFWPGFDEPVDCFLFRFRYGPSGQDWTGIGLAGPLTQAIVLNLENLDLHDAYALFAGWFAEHEEISQRFAEDEEQASFGTYVSARERLQNAGISDSQLELIGNFFGDTLLVARGVWQSQPGFAVVDAHSWQWYPSGTGQNALRADGAYNIHKGRLLLRSFNPEFLADSETRPDVEE